MRYWFKFCLYDWPITIKEQAVKKYLQTRTWRSSKEGFGIDIQILWHVYTYKVQNRAGNGFPCGTLQKWEFTVKRQNEKNTDTVDLWSWRWLQKIPWTVKKTNKSITEQINSQFLFKAEMTRFKFLYFGQICENPAPLRSL